MFSDELNLYSFVDLLACSKSLKVQTVLLSLSLFVAKSDIVNQLKRTIQSRIHIPVYISGAEWQQVNSFRFLGITIAESLSCTTHISTLVEKDLLHSFQENLRGQISLSCSCQLSQRWDTEHSYWKHHH